MKGLLRKYQKLGLTLAAAAMLLTSGLSAHAAVVNTTGNTQSSPNQVISSGQIGENSTHLWTRDEMLSAIFGGPAQIGHVLTPANIDGALASIRDERERFIARKR